MGMICRECGNPLPENSKRRRRFCGDCLKKHQRENYKRYYYAHKADENLYSKETYIFYKERGICVSCHHERAVVLPDGKRLARCQRCLERGNESQRRSRRKKKKA